MFTLTSVSFEPEAPHLPFTASMESEKYPFFGTQFHPEKPAFFFRDDYGVNHTWQSIQINRHFADFFVSKARQNPNSYGGFSETQKVIIQNFPRIITDTYYGEVYTFSSNFIQ